MANTDYGAIPLTLAEGVSQMLNKKLSVTTGFKPSEWADNINLLGKLPIKTASGSIAHFDDGADDVPLKSYKFGISAVQSGSGTPSPINQRPISGWNKVSGQGTGKNLFDKTSGQTLDTYIASDGTLKYNINTRCIYIACKPNTNYVASKKLGQRFTLSYSTESAVPTTGVSLSGITSSSTTVGDRQYIPITTGANAKWLVAYVYHASYDTDTAQEMIDSVQIEVGSTATAYSPYTATPFEIPLGDTIYGGWVDEQGNGEVTHKLISLADFASSYVYESSNRWRLAIDDIVSLSGRNADLLSDRWIADVTASSGSEGKMIHVTKTVYFYTMDSTNTPTGQLLYVLATPIPFTLSDMPVLNSRLGTNNFWVDSGDSEAQYRQNIPDGGTVIKYLLDRSELIANTYINSSSPGSATTYNGWSATPYIAIPDGVTKVKFSATGNGVGYSAFYSGTGGTAGEYISPISESNGYSEITVPSGAKYLRYSNSDSNMAKTMIWCDL